jgi:hypothetical protein
MPEHATIVMTPTATESQWRVERWFYISIALFIVSIAALDTSSSSLLDPSITSPDTCTSAFFTVRVNLNGGS